MWRAITDDDIRSAISSTEETSCRTKLLAEGQSDPFAQIITQVTQNFRNAIRANRSNLLDADPTTLPEGAIFHAVAIIRHRLCGRFNVGEQTETRRDEYKEAKDYLKELPHGPPVEHPGTEPVRNPIPSPAINSNHSREDWRHQDGI